MNRRQFLGSVGCTPWLVGCASARRSEGSSIAISGGPTVPLDAIRRLIIEHTDPILGRCRYVADTGTQRIAQPIVLARRGDRFEGVIENRLPQPTTVHFHGLTLSEGQDGAGFDPIEPGATKALRFDVKNRAGLYWFHAHPHAFTAEQVHGGLAGLFVVSDDEDAALDRALELPAGNRLALMLGDVRMAGKMLRPYAPTSDDCLHGWFGNRALVNGSLSAAYAVEAGWVRLQLLNACNARGLLLAFRDGEASVPFHLIGTDGGLLAAPIAVERVFLYSGERVDIAIDVSGRRDLAAVSLAFDPRHQTRGGHVAHRHPARDRYPSLAAEKICGDTSAKDGFLPDGAALPLFTLRAGGTGSATPLPARLSNLAEPVEANAATRSLRLDFDERLGFLIDGKAYSPDEMAFSIGRGTREIWEVRNSPISMPHPMHLHGFSFRVLRRRGTFGPARALATHSGGRLATDLGIKDTVVLWPNETVWLAVDFALPDDAAFRGRQRYMFHCHNLEHEDGMMMRNFAVA